MIRTVIIDDEPRNIKLLAKIIGEYCPQLEVVGTADEFKTALQLVEDMRPALLLLDIEFPPGNIFSLLEKLNFRNFYIIFITAHNTYATEAFRQNAVDYILKPVTAEAIVEAVKRLEERIQYSAVADISKLLETMKSGLDQQRKIALPSAEGLLFIDEADIVHCEASGRYTILYLTNGKKLTVTRTLKEIESLLNPRQFFRVHHSHVINLKRIVKYHRRHGGIAELTDGSLVDVSSTRKNTLLGFLTNGQGY
jgi:two-component system, LytTR family, response regulator